MSLMIGANRLIVAACSLAALLTVGCSTGDFVPVAGTVTFDGGPPPYAGTVNFVATESGGDLPARDGWGRFTTSGEFEAVTGQQEGLLPGKYRVKVQCNKYEPDYSKKDPFADATVVDPSYKPMEITVEKGSPQRDLKIEVPLKK